MVGGFLISSSIHRSFGQNMNFICFCVVWLVSVSDCMQGLSTKYSPQRVGLQHLMKDEDVIQIIKK